jgi:hypothetical protein
MRAALQWARRLCFATSAACLVAGVVPPGAHAQTNPEEGRPSIYTAYGAAAGIHQQTDKIGGLAATAEPAYSSYPEALSVLGSDITNARASTYYPGTTLPGLGPLLCNQVFQNTEPLCPPPAYPISVAAPTTDGKPDGASTTTQELGTGGPFVISATSAKAHADRLSASAEALNGGAKQTTQASTAGAVLSFRRAVALATGGPVAAAAVRPAAEDPNTMTAGHMEASSLVSFPDPANTALLVATAKSVVTGVNLLGGAVHIDSITTSSTYRTDGRAPPSHDNQVVVSGVTAGGQPAVIDNNGIKVLGAGQGKPVLDAVNTALQQLMATTGTGIRLVNANAASDGKAPPPALTSESFAAGCGKGEADGVQFFQQANLNAANGGVYYVNATLGSACTDGVASSERGLIPETPIDAPAVDTGGLPLDTGSGALPPSDTGVTGSASPAAPTASSGSRPATAGGTSTRRITLGGLEAAFGRNVSDRLTWLYLAFTLAFIGLCLGGRFRTAARLPRHR